MKCPVCKEVDLSIADRQGVEIDFCPQCRGVWLDRGELDKIIERSGVAAAPARPYSNEHKEHEDSRGQGHGQGHGQGQGQGHKKSRGGFLGNLFDF